MIGNDQIFEIPAGTFFNESLIDDIMTQSSSFQRPPKIVHRRLSLLWVSYRAGPFGNRKHVLKFQVLVNALNAV